MSNYYDENNTFGGYGAPASTDFGYAPIPTPQKPDFSNGAKIKVIGVGGAGGNAVNRLIDTNLKGAEFIVVNTDNQDLACSKAPIRIQIGVELTKGLGAGSDINVGKLAAEENKADIQKVLEGTDLLFIAAGMGGGTGTGAAPVVAKLAKDMKILTVAVVTLPFTFEGKNRMDNAIAGIDELKKNVDSLIIIPNDKIMDAVDDVTPFEDSLKVADEILHQGIRGITDLITEHSLINLDFADVKTTLKGKGFAHMGIGVAKGEFRIGEAVRYAVCSPLLNTTIVGAKSVILNIVGGKGLTIAEVSEAAGLVKSVIDYSANMIFGASIDERMGDEVEIVVIATGFDDNSVSAYTPESTTASAQRAAELSVKIEKAYQERKEAEKLLKINRMGQTAETTPPAYTQPTYGQPVMGNATPVTPVYPYAQTAQPIQPISQPYAGQSMQQPISQPYVPQPTQTIQQAPTDFEPGDPILDELTEQPQEEPKGGLSGFFKKLMQPKKK